MVVALQYCTCIPVYSIVHNETKESNTLFKHVLTVYTGLTGILRCSLVLYWFLQCDRVSHWLCPWAYIVVQHVYLHFIILEDV